MWKEWQAQEKSNIGNFNELAYSNNGYLWRLKPLMKGGWETLP